MICGLSYYQICLFFLIYSFLGWVLEVVFHAVVLGKIINRGFLNGPVCPVYAFGALGILALVNTLEAHGILSSVSSPDIQAAGLSLAEGKSHYSREALELLLLFLIGMALTTLVELIAGWLLYTLFHARWWDYSNLPFNFHGYICLKFSILWGIAVVFAVRILHPIIQRGSSEMIPPDWGWPCMAVLYMIYLGLYNFYYSFLAADPETGDTRKRVNTKESRNLAQAVQSAVKYNRVNGITNAYGLSIYFPNSSLKSVNSMIQICEQIGVDS